MKFGAWVPDRDMLHNNGLLLFSKLIRTKNILNLQEQSEFKPTKVKLTKCLTTFDLCSLGVGSCVGTGMYLVAGMVARKVAGPGVIFSFIIAAIASIFSGACYAEFGVRVPHTSGSAYMYSYVTVGEFIAFIIGWNMILEYLIGTSACACALSACLDALTNGAISKSTMENVGSLFGRSPDLLAFVITILMMFLLVAGVKKSLMFNNVLNAINLSVWIFIMTAGLFYVKLENWTHDGFLPYGWSGVFTGAATCFYAFIGFDIIATTGEEAKNPKKSIPYAIVSSLCIILVAYVTSSIMLTLIVPYKEVDEKSALVQMFAQVGAYKCQYIVAFGALAGLTVSMFGSMFPMPRIVYAMASDGLIFRTFSQVWESTGTPAFATCITGLGAAIAAFFIKLEILVEMMSIGTLLAYTLVSTCVLILRYQPCSTNLVDLLPQNLRMPAKTSTGNEQVLVIDATNTELQRDSPKDGTNLSKAHISNHNAFQQPVQRIMVRRFTRSSPDSDDTYPGDDPEEFSMRDDQFLVSDKTENKFYGTLHGPSSLGTTGGAIGATVGPTIGRIGRKLQEATYLCPGLFPWVDPGAATAESGMFVIKMVGIFYILVISMDLIIVCAMNNMSDFTAFLLMILLFSIIAILLIISRRPQNRNHLQFKTPGLPFVPAVAITVNIYLIFKLSILTLIRFTIWMALGFIMYFYYGIKNSLLEEVSNEDSNNMELKLQEINKPENFKDDKYIQYEDTNINIYDDSYWDPNELWNKANTYVPGTENFNVN